MSFGPNRAIAEIDSIRYMINPDMKPTYPPMTGDPKARQRHMTNERPAGLPEYWRPMPSGR